MGEFTFTCRQWSSTSRKGAASIIRRYIGEESKDVNEVFDYVLAAAAAAGEGLKLQPSCEREGKQPGAGKRNAGFFSPDRCVGHGTKEPQLESGEGLGEGFGRFSVLVFPPFWVIPSLSRDLRIRPMPIACLHSLLFHLCSGPYNQSQLQSHMLRSLSPA